MKNIREWRLLLTFIILFFFGVFLFEIDDVFFFGIGDVFSFGICDDDS
jgi:hypothetical protein